MKATLLKISQCFSAKEEKKEKRVTTESSSNSNLILRARWILNNEALNYSSIKWGLIAQHCVSSKTPQKERKISAGLLIGRMFISNKRNSCWWQRSPGTWMTHIFYNLSLHLWEFHQKSGLIIRAFHSFPFHFFTRPEICLVGMQLILIFTFGLFVLQQMLIPILTFGLV